MCLQSESSNKYKSAALAESSLIPEVEFMNEFSEFADLRFPYTMFKIYNFKPLLLKGRGGGNPGDCE
jgi:hypothetical protein